MPSVLTATAAIRAGHALRAVAMLGVWALAAADASALSLGRPVGDPQLGRPLRISVPLQLDPADSSPCIQATLQQGDAAAAALEWTLEPMAGAWLIRLRSADSVREPVITVAIAIGCGQQFTRGYVLLAEPPPAREASQPLAETPAEPPLAARQALPVMPSEEAAAPAARLRAAARLAPTTAKGTAPARGEPPRPDRAAAAPSPVAVPTAPGRGAGSSVRSQPPAAGPRLRVELFDARVDQAPALRLTMALEKPPAADDPRRAEAAALWQATRMAPEAAASQALQAPLRQAQAQSLRDLQGRQAQADGILSESLAKAVAQRDLMLAAGAGLAVCLAALLALGLRARRAARRPPLAQAAADAPLTPLAGSEPPPDGRHRPVRASVPGALAAAAPAATAPDPRLGSAPVASADELLDIQQKADFFVAVGRVDEAVALLEAQLDEPMGGLPYLWLDVLDLCHRSGRPDDYERIRARFQRRFSTHLPAFEAARPEAGGLERYPRVLSRVEVLWPSVKAMSVIEGALFEAPAPGGIPLDLEASRELLLLYGVLLELQSEAQAEPDFTPTMEAPLMGRARPSSTEPIPLSVLAALDAEEGGEEAEPAGADPLHGLDLDFSLATTPGRVEGQVHA